MHTDASEPGLDDDVVLDGVLRLLGAEGAAVRELPGGSVNRTYLVVAPRTEPVVVRFPVDRRRPDEFPVEAWATSATTAVGVPVARVIRHGTVGGVPYCVSMYVEPAHEPVDRPWTRLGEYARALAVMDPGSAPDEVFSRFGRDLERAWHAHLAYNAVELEPGDVLEGSGVYRSVDREVLVETVRRLDRARFRFGAAHGDLAPRNLVARGSRAEPVLIDWGGTRTGPAPWTDAQQVFLRARVEDAIAERDLDAFLRAAGVEGRDDQRMLGRLAALHLIDTARWAREHRPDLAPSYAVSAASGLRRLLPMLR